MLNIGMAVMYHPSRTPQARALAERCSPLRPVLVEDPDPAGVPSPLRTAKLAWAASRPDATHHLVLQDDAVLAEDFLEHLEAVVTRRPSHGIALYVNRGSLRNGYLVRRAAAMGARWSPLSRSEYTPTLGFLLPAENARSLADYLRTVPDEFRDDDEVVTLFCRERGIPVVATVPNLLDHGDLPSVAGNHGHGARHAAVFGDHVKMTPGYWDGGPEAAGRCPDVPPFVLEMHDSRCLIRFTRPGTGEPVDHVYGWYWHDWCELLNVDAAHVTETWRAQVADRSAVSLEFWAAGYLLGSDVSRSPEGAGNDRPALRAAVESWADCGLSPHDDLDPAGRQALVEICLAGFRTGGDRSAEELDELIDRMARREAEVLTLEPPNEVRVQAPETQILLEIRRCPWCGAAPDARMPLREAAPYEGGVAPVPVLTALSCEEVPARNLLALRGREGGARLRTRAAFWADLVERTEAGLSDDEVLRGIRELDEHEAANRVLPVSSRLAGIADSTHFLTVHADSPFVGRLNRRYRAARLAVVGAALWGGS
ncbi:hypothetical protein [Streptosporangium sp. NPDC000396]|uniref:hypothetical protein n=1 Tax=Streptosporangium sp. NPDC000396 TaxID=3366185 RepID=UPI0036873AC2